MKTIPSTRHTLLCLTAITLCLLELPMLRSSHAVTLEKLQTGLPKQILIWSAAREDRIYDSETIFGYIDGAAEVYRAYNMRRCLSRRYASPDGPAIVLDIFDMGSSDDAYGVFTHDPEGEVVELGQDGRLRPGWLNFWKDRFFISIYSEEETALAIEAVKALGKIIDSLISTRGAKPAILKLLPAEGLETDTVRYLHHPMILNYHFYISDTNLLNLSSQTDAVLASYQHRAEKARILVAFYPEPDVAARAFANFMKHYLGDADKNNMARLENNKWCAAKVKDRLLTIVLEADSRQFAAKLITSVQQK